MAKANDKILHRTSAHYGAVKPNKSNQASDAVPTLEYLSEPLSHKRDSSSSSGSSYKVPAELIQAARVVAEPNHCRRTVFPSLWNILRPSELSALNVTLLPWLLFCRRETAYMRLVPSLGRLTVSLAINLSPRRRNPQTIAWRNGQLPTGGWLISNRKVPVPLLQRATRCAG